MLTYENLVGNQEDWAQFITNVEMRETPFLDWLPVGDKPVNVLYQYQAEQYDSPVKNAHVDGKPWTGFKSVGEGRGVLKGLVQWFDKTGSISKLSQDVSDIAGLADQLAKDIPKRLKEMSTDMEANFLDAWDCREGNEVQGYLTRAVGSWLSTSAQALYPVPADFLLPSASVSTTASGSLTEDTIRDILQSIGTTTKSKAPITAFVGPSLKRKFSDFPLFIPSSTSTGATGIVQYKADAKEWERCVERYSSDFGAVDLMLDYWINAVDGTAITQKWTGYFLHRDRWEVRWNQKPKVYRPEFKGGSYEYAMDAICMLVCKNPKGEGKYAPTS
jgi:hypothetical protein